ncbi:MAG: amidinotransferase [Candidatus Aminicenantes bacterium]|nr:amidinotransferase [Candidatus Aminicenantes bacterium]
MTEFKRAIVRIPGPDAAAGLTTAGLGRPDHSLLLSQHSVYVETLRRLGLEVEVLPAASGFPDSYFIEDTAVVTPEVAMIARPGAPSRRGETAAIEPALAKHRPLARIEPPGTLDGGDVLFAGGRFFVGLSERTNEDGARQLGRILESHGYSWTAVQVGRGLHLKSFVNTLGGRNLAVTAGFESGEIFREFNRIVLDPRDGYAANTLWINGTLIMPKGFPRVHEKFADLGLPIIEIDTSEMRKMDGGLTCLSLRF